MHINTVIPFLIQIENHQEKQEVNNTSIYSVSTPLSVYLEWLYCLTLRILLDL